MVSHKVLVAVDGSKQSMNAVRYVSRMFPPERTRVVLLYVMNKVPEFFYDLGRVPDAHETSVTMEAWERALKDSIHVFMQECHQRLVNRGFKEGAITLMTKERRVGIARDIIAESRSGYTAVVAGRTGLNRSEEMILGSVAVKLLEKVVHIPLCLIDSRPETGKVLVALDESKGAGKGADFAASLVGGASFEVILFHVIRGIHSAEQGYGDVFDKKYTEELEKMGRLEIEGAFRYAKGRIAEAGLDPRSIEARLVTGVASRAAAIVQEAKKENCGTIVVGRRGLSRVQEFFMGRVAHKVVYLGKERAVWVVS